MKSNFHSVFTKTILILAQMTVLSATVFGVDLRNELIRFSPGDKPWAVINGEERSSGKFYGYRNASTGPGDDAFVLAKNWADAHNTPLVVLFDNGSGNTLVADLNDDTDYSGGRYLTQWMNSKAGPQNYNCMFTYFKGTTEAPAACKDAYDFCRKCGAGTAFPILVCYWKWPDGTIKTAVSSSLSSVGSFETPINKFLKDNKPPPTPPYVPPKSNAAFAVKDGGLEAAPATEQVYVPIVRTNGTNRAETEFLVADYPDGTATTNDLAWAVGGAYLESPVPVAGALTNVGDKVALYLLNTNKIVVATNSITCAARPANAATFPYYPGEVDSLAVGEWSMDAGFIGSGSAGGAGFFMVLSGAVSADAAFTALLGSEGYCEWAQSNKVCNVVLDASLLSYASPAGAAYRSVNGISTAKADEYSEAVAAAAAVWRRDSDFPDVPEALLVRADGTVAGVLVPYSDSDGYDVAENVARLGELVANSADAAEAANDAPATVPGSPASSDFEFGGAATGVLTVNDTVDCFRLVGAGWTGRKVVFAIAGAGAESSWPNVGVLRYDEASGECVEIEGEISVFATNGVRDAEIVFSFAPEDIAAGRIFAAARAYEFAEEDKFGGQSAFAYSVTAYEATPNSGIVTFDEQPETAVVQEATNQVFNVPLLRIFGSDGDVSVTVDIDQDLTTATGRYEFVSDTLAWTNGETGVKYVPITLKGSERNDGLYDITLRIEEIDALKGVERYFTTYTISYGKEPTEEGQLVVVSVSPAPRADGRVYARCLPDGALHVDDVISVQVNRSGGKGPTAAYISWKNGREQEKETLAWANYLTGTQTAFLEDDFPVPGKSGYADVTVSVTSSNSVPVVRDGASFKVRLMAPDAPFFGDAEAAWSGVQYTTTDTNLTVFAAPAGMAVKSLAKVSGSVPAGLKVSLADGQLRVTGTPTAGTVASTAVYWVTLVREDGSTLRSMPVTVSFSNRALADVNPGFTSSRSWTGLPLLRGAELAGTLDLSVAKNGKTSAKYHMVGGKTVAFSAPGLAGVDEDTGDVELRAVKSVRRGGVAVPYVISAVLGADGSLEATVTGDEAGAVAASVPAGAEMWSKTHTAEAFGGRYVAAFPLLDPDNAHTNTLCFGSPAAWLRCDSTNAWRRGAVMFAVMLPNGRTASGSATFAPTTNGAASASLPLFASASADTFSALLDLDGARPAATGWAVPYWVHNEAGIDELSYDNDYGVVGALWTPDAWSWQGERVSVNMASGAVSGKTRVDHSGTGRLATVSWRGVAIPGATPSIRGAYWLQQSVPYGTGKRRSVRVGDAVEMK